MIYPHTLQYLSRIEQQMKALSLWSDISPSQSALQSAVPFACDSMSFENWLQFLFLPRMYELVIRSQPLPTAFAIAPMAQQVWLSNSEYLPLINLLEELDRLLNERR